MFVNESYTRQRVEDHGQLQSSRREARADVLKPLQGGIAKPQLPPRSRKWEESAWRPSPLSLPSPPPKPSLREQSFQQVILGSNPYVSRLTRDSSQIAPARGVDNLDAHGSMDDVPTVIHLRVSIRELGTRQPRMAPLLMKLRNKISLPDFWVASTEQNAEAMREAKLTAVSPCSFTFKCTPEAKSADGSPPKKFRRHCVASRSHDSDHFFGGLLDVCLREGKDRVEKLIDDAKKKAKRARVLRTNVPRSKTACAERDPAKVDVPTEVRVWASVKIFHWRS